MTRYWVIAPFDSTLVEVWNRVWRFDLSKGIISIGWGKVGDPSNLSESELKDAIQREYSNVKRSKPLWNFYHGIQAGDIVIARRGRKRIAAVGTVIGPAYYSREKNIEVTGPDHTYSNHLDVRWHEAPRDKEFDRIVFGMQTIYEISESKYQELLSESIEDKVVTIAEQGVENRTEFVLERYLEDFIVSNFARIFGDELVIYIDSEEDTVARQYATDVGVIDILAQEPETNSFVVIELKRGRESDKVIGQVLRYMGWFSENLCQDG